MGIGHIWPLASIKRSARIWVVIQVSSKLSLRRD
jgi:hypothetical protein